MKLALHLPANAGPMGHSNVQPERRMLLAKRRWDLGIHRGAGIPVAWSEQRLGAEMLGIKEEETDGLQIIGAPYNHAFMPMLVGAEHHARLLLRWGVPGNTGVYFFGEYAPAMEDDLEDDVRVVLTHPSPIAFARRKSTGQPIALPEGCTCWRWKNRLYVPMEGTDGIIKAFFTAQRQWTNEAWRALVREIELARSSAQQFGVVYIDAEAPYVGSNHPTEVWERFYETINDFALTDAFVPINEPIAHWSETAMELGDDEDVMMWRDDKKWLGRSRQFTLLQDLLAAVPRLDDAESEHCLFAMLSGSDRWSAQDSIDRMREKGPIVLTDADGGPITIGFDAAQVRIWDALMTNATSQGHASPSVIVRMLTPFSEAEEWEFDMVARWLETFVEG